MLVVKFHDPTFGIMREEKIDKFTVDPDDENEVTFTIMQSDKKIEFTIPRKLICFIVEVKLLLKGQFNCYGSIERKIIET